MSRYTLTVPGESQGARYRLHVPTESVSQPSIEDQATAVAGSFGAGVADPFLGAAQGIYKGAEWITSAGGYAPNPVSRWMGDGAQDVRDAVQRMNAGVQGLRGEAGFDGVDVARLAGNVASPVNVVAGARLAGMGSGVLARAGQGAIAGGIGAATMPVLNQDFWAAKFGQTTAGAAGGAVAGPIVGKLIDGIGGAVDRIAVRLGAAKVPSEAEILSRLRFELNREKIPFDEIPAALRRQVAKEVADALKQGREVSGAAVLRKIELDDFGGGTKGQITRDPAQWTREYNLRNVEGAGDPLKAQMANIRTETGARLSRMGAASAKPAVEAGEQLQGVLRSVDDPLKDRVNAAYTAARNADGRYANLSAQDFATMANDSLDEMQLGYFLPGEVRNILNDVASGKTPFNVNTAAQMQTVLSGHARALRKRGEDQAALAVSKVMDALESTPLLDADDTARKAFAAAKDLARQRFQMHKVVPALKDVLDGKTPPESFVSRFVTSGSAKVRDVEALANVLPEEGKQIVREQIAVRLERAAFGPNLTGDTPVAVDRFARQLQSIGKEKLAAFFGQSDTEELFRLARVNAYVTQAPAGATPNRSATGGEIASLLGKIRGLPLAMPAVRGLADMRAAGQAMSTNVPGQPVQILTPALRKLLPVAPISAGAAAGTPFRDP